MLLLIACRAVSELSLFSKTMLPKGNTAAASQEMLQLLLQVITTSLKAQALAKQAAEENDAFDLGNPAVAIIIPRDVICEEAMSAAASLLHAHPEMAAAALRPDAWMSLLTESAGCLRSEELVAAVVVAGGLGHEIQVCGQLLPCRHSQKLLNTMVQRKWHLQRMQSSHEARVEVKH